jgi:oligoribonuclease
VSNLVWVDVETTGLDDERDALVEVAAIVTTPDLEEVMRFQAVIATKLGDWAGVDEVVMRMHTSNGLMVESLYNGNELDDTMQKLAELLRGARVGDELPMLAGASVHFDRRFLVAARPSVDQIISHRHLDTSSLRWMVRAAGGSPPALAREGGHRAMPDIENSLDLARWVRGQMRHARMRYELFLGS